MRVLAIQLKRIGDVILTTPAVAALHAAGHEVTLVVDRGCASLLPAVPGLAESLVHDKRGGNRALWKRLRSGSWDAVLDFTGNDRSAVMTWLSGAGKRITFEWVRARWWKRLIYRAYVDSPVRERHTCDHYLDLVQALDPAAATDPHPRLSLTADAQATAGSLLTAAGISGQYILLHPGTARPEKYWPAANWAELAGHLHAAGHRLALTCGPDPYEQAHVREILQRAAADQIVHLTPPDLLTLAAVVEQARMVISCDTSVVHFAAALQRPQISIFGPTNPYHWRPRHEAAMVLSAAQPDAPLTAFRPKMKGAPTALLPSAAVWKAAEHLLQAKPSASASAGTT